MKLAIVALALLAVSAVAEYRAIPSASDLINDIAHIAALNTEKSGWTAGVNERFNGMSYSDARGLLGTGLVNDVEGLPLLDALDTEVVGDVPDEFDGRTAFAGLIKPIRDQQQCGSCWAFSAVEVLTDRYAIAKNDSTVPVLSPEDLVSCDKSDMGCQGGQLGSAWNYLTNTGVVTDSCFPYTAGKGTAPSCASQCVDGSSFTKYKAKNAGAITSVSQMQQEIMTNGPIQVAFNVYKSFMSYKTGVYKKKFLEFLPEGGHAVKVVGWGTEDGTPYWLVANSWNTSWGEDGYFKIERGTNQCGIEKRGPPYAGMPAL